MGESESTSRITVSKAEASELLGVSIDFLEQHVLPELKVVRRGRKVLVPAREIERWVEDNATLTLGPS